MPADPSASSDKENLDRDPTALTTDALTREVAAIREFIRDEVGHAREICKAEIDRIDDMLKDRSSRVAEQKKDTHDAIDAALSAAEKAALKSEQATKEAIAALGALQTQGFSTIDSALNDVKERITRIESSKLGANAMLASMIALVVAAIVVVGFILNNRP